jgi:hypothetical protein
MRNVPKKIKCIIHSGVIREERIGPKIRLLAKFAIDIFEGINSQSH